MLKVAEVAHEHVVIYKYFWCYRMIVWLKDHEVLSAILIEMVNDNSSVNGRSEKSLKLFRHWACVLCSRTL